MYDHDAFSPLELLRFNFKDVLESKELLGRLVGAAGAARVRASSEEGACMACSRRHPTGKSAPRHSPACSEHVMPVGNRLRQGEPVCLFAYSS